MPRSRFATACAVLLASSLVIASCNSSSPDAAEADENTAAIEAGATSTSTSAASSTTTVAPADGSTTTVPFLDPQDIAVDTANCPAEIGEDGPVKVGVNGGGFNSSAHIDALQATVDEANENGGIDGRPIELVTAIERQSDTPEALTHINALLDRGDLHAIIPWSGWPDPNLVADRFAAECVPALFWLATPAPDAPWIIPGLADRRAEMAVVAEWLVTEIRADHVVLAPVDWPSSLSIGESLRTSLEDRQVAKVTMSPLQVNPATRFQTDANNVDAIVIPDAGAQCIAGVDQAKQQFPDAVIVVSRQCTGYEPADDQTLDGVYRLRLFPGRAPEGLDDPFSDYLAAETTGRALLATLDSANTLDGGLTRANILRAASALTVAVLPLNADPTGEPDAAMVINTRGPDDRFPLESAAVEIFELTPNDGGPTGWNLLGPVIRAEGTTPMTEIDWATPTIEEESRPCVSASGEPEIFTTHWFGEEGELDGQSDIVLYVGNVDVGSAAEASLIATGADGTEVTLTMSLGRGGADCDGELFYDIVLGEAAAIAALAKPVAVRFEVGPIRTGSVTWPDDFPLAPPFGNVDLPLTGE